MSLSIPGKILVVDDKKEDVEEILGSLWKSGQGVIYHEGPEEISRDLINVRLVILDLDLDKCGQVSDNDLSLAALVLKRLKDSGNASLYLIAIWSKHVKHSMDRNTEEILEGLIEEYKKQTGSGIPAIFLKPFGKEIGQEQLVERIQRWKRDNKEAGLIFEWERKLEMARENAVTNLMEVGKKEGISAIIRGLKKQSGNSAPREIIELFNRLVLRNMIKKDEHFKELMDSIEVPEITDENELIKWYSTFHFLQAYYKVSGDEPIQTGDIYEITDAADYRKSYGIVITPRCDLVQDKTDRFKIVYAVKVDDNEETRERAYRIYKPNKPFKNDQGNLTRSTKDFLKNVAKGGKLSNRFYSLLFISSGNTNFHLLLDFHNVESVSENSIKAWSRICRIDTPYIEDILQVYSSLSSRIGTPDIDEKIWNAEFKKLIG